MKYTRLKIIRPDEPTRRRIPPARSPRGTTPRPRPPPASIRAAAVPHRFVRLARVPSAEPLGADALVLLEHPDHLDRVAESALAGHDADLLRRVAQQLLRVPHP